MLVQAMDAVDAAAAAKARSDHEAALAQHQAEVAAHAQAQLDYEAAMVTHTAAMAAHEAQQAAISAATLQQQQMILAQQLAIAHAEAVAAGTAPMYEVGGGSHAVATAATMIGFQDGMRCSTRIRRCNIIWRGMGTSSSSWASWNLSVWILMGRLCCIQTTQRITRSSEGPTAFLSGCQSLEPPTWSSQCRVVVALDVE
ncbi:MAG: hypothetical protein WDW38_003576 [Sanguina aurantia]